MAPDGRSTAYRSGTRRPWIRDGDPTVAGAHHVVASGVLIVEHPRAVTDSRSGTIRAPSGLLTVPGLARTVPGLTAAALVAVVAVLVASWLPAAISAVAVALIVGIVAGRFLPGPVMAPGVLVATRQVLRTGVVLLGARVVLDEIVTLGARVAVMVALVLVAGFAVAALVARALGISAERSVLLGVGSAICGNSAIIATSPVIRARPADVGVAVTAITVWGTLGVLVYPLVGAILGLSDTAFGVWVGLAVQDTSQVVAAGAAYSEAARDTAVIVKLIRNTALVVVLPVVAVGWPRSSADRVRLRGTVPLFVIGFLAVSALRTFGVIDVAVADTLGRVSGWMILIAVAGLGLATPLEAIGRRGVRAFIAAGAASLTLAVVGLLAATSV